MSELPSTWATTSLGSVIELNPKNTEISDETLVGFVPMALLGKSYLDSVTFQPKPWAAVKRGYSHFRNGDVLLAKITPCFENGKAGLVLGLPNGMGAGSTEYFVCRPKAGVVDARYLLAFLKRPEFVSMGAAQMTGSVGHKRVPKEYLCESSFPLAPLREQTRVADQLDKLLARIQACSDRLDTIPALLKRFRQAVLESALYGGLLDDAASSENEEISVPIAAIASVGTGSTPLRSDGRFFASSGTPWVTSAATSNKLITQANEFVTQQAIEARRLRLYPKGTLLVAMYGEGKTRGQVAELGIDATVNQACAAVVVDETKALTSYVKLALQVNYLSMRELAEGGNQPNLNLSKVKNFRIPLPSLERQQQIVRETNAFLSIADRIEARYTAARAQAQRLTPLMLTKAFRGELVQQDPQDEPASVLLERIAAAPPAKARISRGRPRIQPQRQSAASELDPTDWASLPDDAWAAPADPDGHATMVWLTAVLRAWGEPMPERAARLAVLLCQQPRLFTAVLPAAEATQWSRLVGDEARPLPTQVLSFRPAINSHWGRSIKGMRVRDDLVEAGLGDGITWALGAGAASIETAGWPDGRAGFVVAHLRVHGIASVLPLLEPSAQEFVDARAA